jgi:hypothetical protein
MSEPEDGPPPVIVDVVMDAAEACFVLLEAAERGSIPVGDIGAMQLEIDALFMDVEDLQHWLTEQRKKHVAELLGVTAHTVERWTQDVALPCYQRDTGLFGSTEMEAWIQGSSGVAASIKHS